MVLENRGSLKDLPFLVDPRNTKRLAFAIKFVSTAFALDQLRRS